MNREISFSLTNLIIAINIVVFILQNIFPWLTVLLGLNYLYFQQHLYFQLLSTMFVHGNFGHILMNMAVLYQFGNQIENLIGKIRFGLLYFVGGIATSFVSIYYNYFTNEVVNLVGASGAISVLLGWYALKDRYQREGIIVWILLISFAPLLLGMPIAWYSHIAGFIIGFISGYIL